VTRFVNSGAPVRALYSLIPLEPSGAPVITNTFDPETATLPVAPRPETDHRAVGDPDILKAYNVLLFVTSESV